MEQKDMTHAGRMTSVKCHLMSQTRLLDANCFILPSGIVHIMVVAQDVYTLLYI